MIRQGDSHKVLKGSLFAAVHLGLGHKESRRSVFALARAVRIEVKDSVVVNSLPCLRQAVHYREATDDGEVGALDNSGEGKFGGAFAEY